MIDAIPKLLEVVCRSTGMGFAAVARVTENRWVACAVRDEIDFGLTPGGELDVMTTLCNEVRGTGYPVIIDDVAADPVFKDHPTPAMYGFRSYISVPIRYGDRFFGTLCAIDPAPRSLKASTAPKLFELFAELIGAHLEARQRFSASQDALLSERGAAELREQFIAVLGHDLRNPLASIDAGARLLRKTSLDERATKLIDAMQSSVQRMAGLIDNVLDLARGRLGGGFVAERRPEATLADSLQQVIAELQVAHPGRRIESRIRIDRIVDADSRRLAQLLSNLIANALTHGDPEQPVHIEASAGDDLLRIEVANAGEPIPEAARANLFLPFTRAAHRPTQQGLGLGLWIASEIARAHNATLTVASDATETRFSLCMPLQPAKAFAATS